LAVPFATPESVYACGQERMRKAYSSQIYRVFSNPIESV